MAVTATSPTSKAFEKGQERHFGTIDFLPVVFNQGNEEKMSCNQKLQYD